MPNKVSNQILSILTEQPHTQRNQDFKDDQSWGHPKHNNNIWIGKTTLNLKKFQKQKARAW